MIQVLHISAECYPAAKTGGLGDVVGSLPKYMTQAGVMAAAVIPKYALKWIHSRNWETVYHGAIRSDWRHIPFSVQQEKGNSLGFPFFVVDIPGLYDRPGIYNDPSGYPYGDEIERYLVFQQTVLQWVISFPESDRPKVLHAHDHHSGLIPFMCKHSPDFRPLANMPTVFTIHNGQYQGAFSWRSHAILPYYDAWARGYLDWNGAVNPMAAAVKCAWAVTTVSNSYLYELHQDSRGLEPLFRAEWAKEFGIINGIDVQVWDPETDPAIQFQLEKGEKDNQAERIASFKKKNKKVLCEWFGFPEDQPLVSFIGRMVSEKGSDLLPDAYKSYIHAGGAGNFLILGTGESWTEDQFRSMSYHYRGRVNAVIDYNEALAHQIYAGSDFLIMPSRVEPCGLNQLYAMRYGTIPIVRSIGGLKDTVPDIAEPDGHGRGIRFDHFSLDDIGYAIHRAASMWGNEPGIVDVLRQRIMAVDSSWERAVQQYFNVYQHIGANIKKVSSKDPKPGQGEQKSPEPVKEAPKKAEKVSNPARKSLRAKKSPTKAKKTTKP
ncbi:MAG: glycogen/starch synthase [Saprospiraceae bacterium]|nr:glycogen synthase [Saprospiraceae bacterium]MCB9344464.1 glycogen synthase [Lewinellaceae bacterium]